jgi:hypothetical protein
VRHPEEGLWVYLLERERIVVGTMRGLSAINCFLEAILFYFILDG